MGLFVVVQPLTLWFIWQPSLVSRRTAAAGLLIRRLFPVIRWLWLSLQEGTCTRSRTVANREREKEKVAARSVHLPSASSPLIETLWPKVKEHPPPPWPTSLTPLPAPPMPAEGIPGRNTSLQSLLVTPACLLRCFRCKFESQSGMAAFIIPGICQRCTEVREPQRHNLH